jgi:hypothetical protein
MIARPPACQSDRHRRRHYSNKKLVAPCQAPPSPIPILDPKTLPEMRTGYNGDQIGGALTRLATAGKAMPSIRNTGGRPVEIWRAL